MNWDFIIELIIVLILIGSVLVLLRYFLNWLFSVELRPKKLPVGLYFFALIVTTFALYQSIFNNPNSSYPVVDEVAGKLIIVVVILCLLPSVQPLLPSIKSMKILDFIEFTQEIKKVKEDVNSGLDNVNRTLSTLIAIQNVNVSQRANQHLELTINNLVRNQVDDIKKLSNDLNRNYNIDESDIPSSSIGEGDKTSSLLRLRLNIEEKLRSIAQLADITSSQDVLKLVKSLFDQELIDQSLADAIEKIIRVTKEITQMGIELRSDLAEEILTSGEVVLLALHKVEEKIQQRYSRNNREFFGERNEYGRGNF